MGKKKCIFENYVILMIFENYVILMIFEKLF